MIQIIILHCSIHNPQSASLVSIIGTFAAILVAIVALFQYWQNNKTKRAELLTTLFEKFYVNDEMKDIREWLDVKNSDEINPESFNKMKSEDKKFERCFSDYLNYFQFLVSLYTLERLEDKEISLMFNYYLMKLKSSMFVMDYLKANGYKALHNYLTQYNNVE